MLTEERLLVIAYNAIMGLHELVGFDGHDVMEYCAMTNDEYSKIMNEDYLEKLKRFGG